MNFIKCMLGGVAVLTLVSCKFFYSDQAKSTFGRAFGRTVIEASDTLVKKVIDIKDFDSITNSTGITIEYHNGRQNIVAEVSNNIIDYLVFEVRDNELSIKTDGADFTKIGKCVIYISTPILESMTINGSGKFIADKGIKSDNIHFQIRGSGKFEVSGLKAKDVSLSIAGSGHYDITDINCESLKTTISGSGSMVLSGKASEVDAQINGSGDINLTKLSADRISNSINGSGKIRSGNTR